MTDAAVSEPAATTGMVTARRIMLLVTAVGLAVADLAIKAWAQVRLDDAPIQGWPVDLRLAYNSGAAFSLAAGAPAWVMLTLTGVLTVGVAVFAWRTAASTALPGRLALAAILAGAAANVIDRAPDGLVTDYLHTGWWPTFNLADSFIVVGATTLVLLVMFGKSHVRHQL